MLQTMEEQRVPLEYIQAHLHSDRAFSDVGGWKVLVLDNIQKAIREMSPNEFKIYIYFISKGGDQFFSASVAEIMEDTGIASNATVIAAIRLLERSGWIVSSREPGEKNHYKVNI